MAEALEVVEENEFNLNLRQLYKYLGLSTSHYTRWAQNLLKPYTEGVEYVIEKGADPNGPKNKVEYFLRPEIAAIIMDKYDIDKKDVLCVLSLSPNKIVQKMVKNNGIEYYAFTICKTYC